MFKPTTLTNTLLRSSSRMASVVAAPRFTAAAGPSTMSRVLPSKRAYHEKVLDHYNKPRNVRTRFYLIHQLRLSQAKRALVLMIGSWMESFVIDRWEA